MFKGRVWLLGDDIDTDIIMPTEYLALKSIDDMKPYAFSPLRPELAGQIKPGDIIVAGEFRLRILERTGAGGYHGPGHPLHYRQVLRENLLPECHQ